MSEALSLPGRPHPSAPAALPPSSEETGEGPARDAGGKDEGDALKLAEPWKTTDRQRVAAQFGVWLFLTTETLFFGGLFMVYAAARWAHPAGFVAGAHETELAFGTVNAVLLLTGSLAMTVGERAVDEGLTRTAKAAFAVTILLGLAFLAVKGFEYRSDIEKHLVPGPGFKLAILGASQFWAFYWTATGIHAIHLTIGLGLIARLLLMRGHELAGRATLAGGVTLYWHLVDIVWVILYPLLYLTGR